MKDYSFITEKLIEVDALTNILKVKGEIRGADTFALMFQDQLRYVPQSKCWYYYDEKRWIKDVGDIYVNKLCKILAEKIKAYCNENISQDDSQAYNAANRWQKRSYRDIIIRDARDVNPLDISSFDKNKNLINLNNGTFDLSKGILLQHSPNDFITKLAPVDYENSLSSDRWDKFISEIMCDDKEMCEYLQKALGYGISGHTTEEALFIFYGESTRNGKGTLMESVLNVMGDYSKTVKPETIASRFSNPSGPNEDIARLKGVRIASLNEPPKAMKLNSAFVKTLTGGDTINARFLHENSFDFVPEFKMYISTNYLPEINDDTVFRSGRVKVIPFLRHFTEKEQDKTLKQFFKNQEQMSAIFNWLICGYYMSLSNFDMPQKAYDVLHNYHMDSDPIFKFYNTMLVASPTSRVQISYVYEHYYNWALSNCKQVLSNREFTRALKQYAPTKVCRIEDKSVRCFIGIELKK